jgi:hypothetical protein
MHATLLACGRPDAGCDLSDLGTYAPDRWAAVEALLVEAARRLPRRRFVIGGATLAEHFGVPNPGIGRSFLDECAGRAAAGGAG